MTTPKRHPLTLAVAMALGLGTSQVVSAAEFTVTNTDDSGAGSLRQAIEGANASIDASNTIVFDAGLTGETITLASDIFVTSNSLTIQGPGPEELIIEQDGRVLTLSSTAASVVISGLTLRHTAGSTSAEGPLFSHSPSLSVDNVHFRGESANVSNSGYGGGCLASSQWTTQVSDVQELNITNSEFDNCRAYPYPGGAVTALQSSSYGGDLSVTIENTIFQNGFAGGGAGTFIRQSTFDGSNETSHAVTIDGLTATNNSNDSVYGGYGVLAILQDRDSSLDIDNLDMSGNSGGSTLEWNPGRESAASIRNSSFSENDADFQPVVLVSAVGDNIDFEWVGSQMTGPSVNAERGLGLFMFSGGGRDISIRDSLFHDNQFNAEVITANLDNGSGSYGSDTLEIVNTTITDNRVGNNALEVTPIGSMINSELRHVTITDNMLAGFQLNSETPSERGEASPPGMITFLDGGERRITNSIIHGVSMDEMLQPRNRGISAFDLTGTGDVSIDHSLIGVVDENLVITDANPGSSFINDGTDPALAVLADNGGATQTRAFISDSPVFDAGNPAAADLPVFDQRGDGFPRASGATPDMGAFELQVAPEVSLSTESLDFPDTRVGTTSGPLTLEVSNTGDFEFNINSVTAGVFRGASLFVADDSDCTGAPVAPGESCSVEVTFSPNDRATFDGTLDLVTDADPSNYSVGLTGTGVAPIIDVAPDVNFGTVVTDTSSDAQTVTIENTGDDALEVTGFDPAVAAPFSLDFSDCGASLPFSVPAGASCDLSATFSPTNAGSADTTVTVESDSLNNDSNQFSLTGEGVSGQLSVSPGNIDFGEVAPGESGEAQLTLSNGGSAPVTVEDWTNLPEPFSISGDCPEPPFTLDPGESCTLTIIFSPESPGDYEEGLVLGFDDGSGASSTQVNVTGRGTAPAAPATPIPTLDRIGLVIGSGLLALLGLLGLRRRRESDRLTG